MQIRGIHASNFMSFAPSPNDFHLDYLAPQLTTLVGPNGAGKSSVFRVVQAILDCLVGGTPGHEPVLPDPTKLYYRPSGADQPIRLTMDIVFDRTDEIETIHTFWQNALLHPGGMSLQGIITLQKGETAAGNQVIPSRFAYYEQWVAENVKPEDVSPLFEGRLVLEMDPQNIHRTILTFECGEPTLPLALGLNGRMSPAGSLCFPLVAKPKGSISLAVAAVRSLPAELGLELVRFLDGQDVLFPQLPPFSFDTLASYCEVSPLYLDTGLDQQRQDTLPAIRVRLNQLLGRSAYDAERCDFADVIERLVRNALICVDTSVRLNLEDTLLLGDQSPPSELLAKGHLALYLFRLKNGSDADRQLFDRVNNTYARLTSASLNAEMRVIPKQTRFGSTPSEVAEHLTVTLTTDEDIPLRYGGSGRAMALFLSALVHQHAGKAILLDEPDAHLHPSLQVELIKELMYPEQQGQYILITHSPYMVPPGGLEHVRRIYKVPGQAGSVASRPFSEEEIRALNLRKRGREPDEHMFLFSRATVFLEGPNDAAVLPVWFEQWAKQHGAPSGEGQRSGIRFQAATGKANIIPMMRVADRFRVPCIAMYDADILHPDPKNKKKKKRKPTVEKAKNDNEAVLNQWQAYGLIEPGQVTLGDQSAISRFPDCAGGRIFLCGKTLDDDLEQLSVFEEHEEEGLTEVGGGPLALRFIAQKYGYPPEYSSFFDRLFEATASLIER